MTHGVGHHSFELLEAPNLVFFNTKPTKLEDRRNLYNFQNLPRHIFKLRLHLGIKPMPFLFLQICYAIQSYVSFVCIAIIFTQVKLFPIIN